MKPPVLFAHGWGFDRTLWDRVIAQLPDRQVFRAECGYLGAAPDWPEVPENTMLVGHSAGIMAMLRRGVASNCAGLVSINGFTRFAGADGFPGVAARVLRRMERELAAAPDVVLRAFRLRCGDAADAPLDTADPARLAAGLHALRHEDARQTLAGSDAPVLALAALDDPIVVPAHADACFGAHRVRWSPCGGHLLPLSRPDWCAAAIDGFAC